MRNVRLKELFVVISEFEPIRIFAGIREFGQQQFKGNYLSVSRAKESFLERLKREREEEQKPKTSQAPTYNRYQDESYNQSYQPLPTIDKEVSSGESSEEEEEIPQPKNIQSNGFAVSFTQVWWTVLTKDFTF